MAVEFFVLADGQIVLNEMAPRVHNSGHWTIEGTVTSQFENHVRACLSLPLGDTQLRSPSLLCNCIGEMPLAHEVLTISDLHLHDYRKAARPLRKVGHLTVLRPEIEQLVGVRQQLIEQGVGTPTGVSLRGD